MARQFVANKYQLVNQELRADYHENAIQIVSGSNDLIIFQCSPAIVDNFGAIYAPITTYTGSIAAGLYTTNEQIGSAIQTCFENARRSGNISLKADTVDIDYGSFLGYSITDNKIYMYISGLSQQYDFILKTSANSRTVGAATALGISTSDITIPVVDLDFGALYTTYAVLPQITRQLNFINKTIEPPISFGMSGPITLKNKNVPYSVKIGN